MTDNTDDTDDTKNDDGYLAGQLLVAMPQMLDERFAKTVIYMCAHSEDGAMGLVVNKVMEEFFQPPFPARAAVGVKQLPKGSQVEAEAVMVIGD